MHVKKLYVMLVTAGLLVLIVSGIALVTVQPVKAQCGSQVSSCKNCHEVQAKDPVNNDGTGWHQSHAFGDLCFTATWTQKPNILLGNLVAAWNLSFGRPAWSR